MPFTGGMIPPAVLARTGALAAAPGLASTCVGLVSQMLIRNQLIGPPILAAAWTLPRLDRGG